MLRIECVTNVAALFFDPLNKLKLEIDLLLPGDPRIILVPLFSSLSDLVD